MDIRTYMILNGAHQGAAGRLPSWQHWVTGEYLIYSDHAYT